MQAVLQRYGLTLTSVIMLITLLWIMVMVVGPQLVMIDYSFRPNLPPTLRGGPDDSYTLTNYLTLADNEIHRAIFFKTIWASALVTFITLVVCYPVAYFLAQLARGRQASFFVLLLVIPFWINEILRTFAWWIILAYNGPLNQILGYLGLIDQPIRYLSGDGGVIIGMVYAYILFMVFPLYNALESLNRNQVEAARDLGAPVWRIHWRVVIPHAKPGIATGCIMTFMLAAGSYAVPALLGSPGSRWFTQIIYNWFFEGGNWNQGAAYAFILLVLCLGFIFAALRLFRVELDDIAK
ncbi:ABC transporter permease [Fodinicurvata halophila]|uniref:ABC transporter permease n=1 Tax=Fodinicurvata halophila TaxID=1419723 RepID=A0ABV8US22_9PROT